MWRALYFLSQKSGCTVKLNIVKRHCSKHRNMHMVWNMKNVGVQTILSLYWNRLPLTTKHNLMRFISWFSNEGSENGWILAEKLAKSKVGHISLNLAQHLQKTMDINGGGGAKKSLLTKIPQKPWLWDRAKEKKLKRWQSYSLYFKSVSLFRSIKKR